MKILTRNGGRVAGSAGPETTARRVSPASAARTPLSTTGLRRMLDCIRAYRAGRLPLSGLVNELEFHLQLLGGAESGWERAFFRSWRDLERLNAAQLKSGSDNLSPAGLARINENLEGLQALISDLLAGAETR